MSTQFPNCVNNAAGTLASAYTSGAGSLVLGSGQGAAFGSSFPIRVCVVTSASYGTTAETMAVFQATGRSGDTLTGVSAIEGSADRNFSVGDYVEMRWTAGEANLIATAVNALEGTLAGCTAGAGGDLIVTSAGLNPSVGGIFLPVTSPGPTVANTTSWASLLSSTITIPAGKLLAGKAIRWRLYGAIGTAGSTQTLSIRILLGGVVVATGQITTVPASMAGQTWLLDRGMIQCQAAGVTGLVNGYFVFQAWSAAGSGVNICGTQAGAGGMGAAATIDTTQALTIDVQAQWQTASASNSIQLKGGHFEIDG